MIGLDDDRVELQSMFIPEWDNGILLLLRRGPIRYVIGTSAGQQKYPEYIASVQGVMSIKQMTRGGNFSSLSIDAQQMGEPNFNLDPICEALRTRGWSEKTISYWPQELDGLTSGWECHIAPRSDLLRAVIRTQWDENEDEFYIIPQNHQETPKASPWNIKVQLFGGRLCLDVVLALPQVYEESSLHSLLEAIKSLPHPQDLGDIVHEDMLAK